MEEFRIEISYLLQTLSYEKSLVFGTLICEKLLPNYQYFYQKKRWGNVDILQNSILQIYQSLGDNFLRLQIHNVINKVETITPNTEDFESILTSFALDTCTSVLSTLNFILDKKPENIVDVAMYACDTIDMYFQGINYSKEEIIINNTIHYDFLEQEKKRQRLTIQLLSEINEITAVDLETLRNIQPLPIIDLSLIPEDLI